MCEDEGEWSVRMRVWWIEEVKQKISSVGEVCKRVSECGMTRWRLGMN